MVNSGDIIKHKSAMDTAVQVMHFTKDPGTQNYLVSGIWINQGQVKTFPMNLLAEFFIKPEHLQNWLRCARPDSDFIRNEEWKPLV